MAVPLSKHADLFLKCAFSLLYSNTFNFRVSNGSWSLIVASVRGPVLYLEMAPLYVLSFNLGTESLDPR